ncbi:MAG: hypothetical protein ACQER9_01840 [Nanobdellota archaeon]
MKKGKSQSEIMGLLMVVVLISVGLLVFVSFSLKNINEKDIVNEYTHKQLPVLLNDAILETHTKDSECYGEKIQALMVKAGEGNNFRCNNKYVRPFLKDKVSYLLNKTLDKWGIKYRYFVYTGNDPVNDNIIEIKNSDCKGMDIDTEIFFFKLESGGFLNIKLDLCS